MAETGFRLSRGLGIYTLPSSYNTSETTQADLAVLE